ncbi:MAG TPA: hypothetical protein VE912_04450, partial [Bacteroidales bacterium]|nr:hypothetical protein [Bacteroidales bacterium]
QPRGLPTTNVTWIKAHSTDIGIDFGFFNNRLSGSIDYFYRKRTGLLAHKNDVLIPVSAGISLPEQNLNSDANMGADGSLTFKNAVNKNFSYTIGVNATFSRRKILHVYHPRFANSWDKYRHGVTNRWAGIQWGYKVVGRFKSQKQINNYPVNEDGKGNTTLLPGDLIFKDVNHDGVINSQDSRPIAYQNGYFNNGLPFLNFGLNAGLHYKNLSLSVEFAGADFSSFLRQYELLVPFQNSGNSPKFIFNNNWHHKNVFDNSSPWVPGYYPPLRKGMNSSTHDLQTSTFDFVNVHYIRLKNLKIGYTLPFKWINRDLNINKLTVYLDGYNLLSLDNLKKFGIDPEINQSNGFNYPQTRIINVGANISF